MEGSATSLTDKVPLGEVQQGMVFHVVFGLEGAPAVGASKWLVIFALGGHPACGSSLVAMATGVPIQGIFPEDRIQWRAGFE